ncbi:MAG: tRNA-dihydrouridine synthase family protein [Lachnospiraceae bacterium]|nr:tRNA-dihydrouridine synthase family protein [Lachnospiraceae bacterium]
MEKKLICGPMATLSHEAFRRIVERFGGVDEHYTEMINAPTLLQGGPFEKYYLMDGPCPEKIVWQLTSNEADAMASAAAFLARRDGVGIDINVGCCAPEIVKSGAGIAWMLKDERETFSMVEKVKSAMENCGAKKRLSIKLRLGDENFSAEGFFKFCEKLCDLGAEQITLHPRTQKEKLARPPRKFFVEELAARLSQKNVPVIFNGNVRDAKSANEVFEECPNAAGIMIIRAAVQKPWVFAQLRAESGKYFCANGNARGEKSVGEIDLLELGLEYIENLQKFQPPEFFRTRMQRFFSYYCDNFSFAHYIKTKMLNSQTREEAEENFRVYFEKVPEDRTICV